MEKEIKEIEVGDGTHGATKLSDGLVPKGRGDVPSAFLFALCVSLSDIALPIEAVEKTVWQE